MLFLIDGFLRIWDMLLRLILPYDCKKISFVAIYSGSQLNMTQLMLVGGPRSSVQVSRPTTTRRSRDTSLHACQLEIAKSFLLLGKIYIVWPKGRMGSLAAAPRGQPYICTSFGRTFFHY